MEKGVKRDAHKYEVIGYVKGKLESLDNEIKHDVTPAVVASFGFIIALVWRDAIKAALDVYLENAGLIERAYLYNFVSAIIVTIVVIGIMMTVARYGRSKKKKRVRKNLEKHLDELRKN